MKTKINTLICIGLVSLLAVGSVLAQTTSSGPVSQFGAPPASLPIQNLGVLKAYALARVRNGWISVNAPSAPKDVFVVANGTNDESVLWVLNSKPLTLSLANTADNVNVGESLNDTIGYQVAGGNLSFQPQLKTGNWGPPYSARVVNLTLNYQQGIEVRGVTSPKAVIRDASSNIVGYANFPVDQAHGLFFYPTNLNGWFGEITVDQAFRGGSVSTVYNIHRGGMIRRL